MNNLQIMLRKINDTKVKIEKEREYIFSVVKQIVEQLQAVKSIDFSTIYGKRVIRLFEKMFGKMADIRNEFENEYADFLGGINNHNDKGDSENE